MNSSLVQEEPQPPQIKEEQEELLLRPGDGLTLLAVKREDDGENRETAPITITSAEHKETYADVKNLDLGLGRPHLFCKENISTEQQEKNYCLVKEEPEPPPIKEERQELLQRPEGGLTAMKSEHDGEKRETEPVASTSTQHMKTLCDAEHCGTPQPTGDDQLHSSHCSESNTEDSDEWEETKEGHSASSQLKSQTTQHVEGHTLSKKLPQDLNSSKQTHTGKERFTCTHCGEMFNHKGDFKRHTMIHTGGKPFTCTVCSKGCSNLKTHMMTHTGKYDFTCTVCGKG